MSRIVYVNGAYLPEEEAKISIFDRGFIFGDGIYEVSAVIGGKLVDCEAHLARLERSCGELGLALPWPKAELVAIHNELIRRNELDEGGIYLQVSRGAADRDFAFPKDVQPTLVMFTQARNFVNAPPAKTGIKVVSHARICAGPAATSRASTCSRRCSPSSSRPKAARRRPGSSRTASSPRAPPRPPGSSRARR